MSSFLKGMAAGLLVGGALTMTMMPKSHKSHKDFKHCTGRLLKNAGSFLESLQAMM